MEINVSFYWKCFKVHVAIVSSCVSTRAIVCSPKYSLFNIDFLLTLWGFYMKTKCSKEAYGLEQWIGEVKTCNEVRTCPHNRIEHYKNQVILTW